LTHNKIQHSFVCLTFHVYDYDELEKNFLNEKNIKGYFFMFFIILLIMKYKLHDNTIHIPLLLGFSCSLKCITSIQIKKYGNAIFGIYTLNDLLKKIFLNELDF